MRQRVPYLVFCGATIALLVFLNATQPFVLSQLLGYEQNGRASGMLALVDEVTSLALAPFWGALSDKVGTRYTAVASMWIMLCALSWYPRAASLVPALLVARGLFAVGAAGAVAMITAGLAELSMLVLDDSPDDSNRSSFMGSRIGTPDGLEEAADDDRTLETVLSHQSFQDGDETVPLFEAPCVDNEVFSAVAGAPRPNGKLAGMVGFASGLGAIFAVTVLLPLPTKLAGETETERLKEAFKIVSLGGAALSLLLLATLYQNPARGLRSFLLGSENVSIFDEAALDAGGSVMTYLDLLKDGFAVAQTDRRLAVAYLGSTIARAASVVLALFIPLWVNQWFYSTGRCPQRSCHEAIVQAAILTGIANTVVLLAAPFVGIAGDRFGAVLVLGGCASVGILSMLMFILIDSPLGVAAVGAACLLGVAQIGCTIMSMSMSTDKRRVSPGSVAGVYSLMGSVGIILITQIGGPLADHWSRSPFLVMSFIFALLVLACHQLSKRTILRSMRSSISL